MRHILQVFDELLLWRPHRAMHFPRAFFYVAVIVAALLATDLREQWQSPGAMPTDGHAYSSFTLAVNRVFCGSTGLSTDAHIGAVYLNRADLVHEPVASVVAGHWGSLERYCSYQHGFYVNNENSLMVLESWIMRAAPRISLGGISRAMLAVRVLMLAVLALALLRTGASVLMSALVLKLVSAMLVEMHKLSDYSVYSFLTCMLAAAIGFYGLAWGRRTARAIGLIGLAAGVMTAFFVNMRTSYLPMFAVLFAMYLAAEVRQSAETSRRRNAVIAAVALFAAGYMAFQYVFISRGRPADGQGYSYHVIAHPLVLSLALPPNPFATSEGIDWFDGIGVKLARRIDPTVQFMGPGYDRALFRYYFGLWRNHPREMLGVYKAKWQIAGIHSVVFSPFTTGAPNLMLEPWRHLPGGFWFMGVFAAVAALSAWAFARTRAPLLLLVSMTSVAGVLLLTELATIMPYYSINYHQTLLFVCGVLTVAGAQMLLSGSAFAVAAAWSAARERAKRPKAAKRTLGERTVADFGDQWTTYTSNDGYYGSPALLQDVFGPLLRLEEFKGAVVADIGAGTGRFTNVFLAAGVARVVAVEPSRAFEVLQRNTAAFRDRVEYLDVLGEDFRPSAPVDFAFSYGVLHHIPDPRPTVAAMREALKPGGRIGIWVYGREGNEAYVAAQKVLGLITSRLPHRLLVALVWLLYWPAAIYTGACRVLPLPMHRYFREVYGKLTPDKQRLNLYDQLNPAHAKYYWQQEVRALLQDAGFVDIELFHRHEYSWTAIAVKP